MKVNPASLNPASLNPASQNPASQNPDAIVVIFGAAVRPDGNPSQVLRHRVDAAARFAARFAHPVFIPTGAKGRYGDAEATVMARQLADGGVPAAAILQETTGTDTLSSVRAVAALVRGASNIYACSSAYHLPRCLILLRLAGIAARACPPPPVPAASTQRRRWYWRLREAVALPYDAVQMVALRVTGRV